MHSIPITNFPDWRRQARAALQFEIPPHAITFHSAHDPQQTLNLFDDEPLPAPTARKQTRPARAPVPKKFVDYARFAACHRDASVLDLMYRLLWRLTHGEPRLLQDASDDDVRQFERAAKAVSRDGHKMKAFVRFRRIEGAGDCPPGATNSASHANANASDATTTERYVAWHRPDHRVLQIVAPFFARRFTDMHWTIMTPFESAVWDRERLTLGPGVPASEAPQGDALDDLWRTYYRNIFNPARIKLNAMRREMPVRYWPTLPETQIIPDMLAEAPQRVAAMIRHAPAAPLSAAEFLPKENDLASLAAAAAKCQGCALCHRATQTVFGRGSATARIMLVGEQPGDEEDRVGQPFIGPAGRVLEEAIAAAGLDADDLYFTNAVKHFHWEPRGKRRMHKRAPSNAVDACRPWLEREAAAAQAQILVCLGVTAAQSVLGRGDNRLTKQRGVPLPCDLAPTALITWHPAVILRATTPEHRESLRNDLIAHLRLAADLA